jgi:transcriptional regulator with XRE-family HTH domain
VETLAGLLRRVRRLADMSQRELSRASGVSSAVIARAEAGGDLRVSQLVRVVGVAGLRLAVLDEGSQELAPMSGDAVRDAGGRLFPAHLDTRHGDDSWWGGEHRPRTRQPRYTFDLDRGLRDSRRRDATPEDHHAPTAGDSLAERRAERAAVAARRRQARHDQAHQARLAAGVVSAPDWGTGCTCPADCEYAEGRNEDLSHATSCSCCCDLD